MAKEISLMGTDSYQALGIVGILRKSLNLPFRNGKLMSSVLFLVFLPFYLLVLLHHVLVGPLTEKFEDEEESSSQFSKDLGLFVGLQFGFLLAFAVVSVFGLTATIHASSVTYIGKSLSVKELLPRIRETWKRPVITWLYIILITILYLLLLVIVFGAFSLFTSIDAMATWSSLVGLLAALFYLYLAVVWTIGLVISVVEDCNGIQALGKAGALIKGRKVQGFVLMLLLELLSGPISVIFIIVTTENDLGALIQFAFLSVVTVLFCIAKLFLFVVYTVFYYECKQSHGEIVEMEIGSGYNLVPSKTHVNVCVP